MEDMETFIAPGREVRDGEYQLMKLTGLIKSWAAKSNGDHRILHMASFSRSGETLMLRCLDAHPGIHVVHHIHQPELPENKQLFRLLRKWKKITIPAATSQIQAAKVPAGATLVLKNAEWTHRWPSDGFVMVRNPLSVVNSLNRRLPNPERWARGIAPSLLNAMIDKPPAEKVALVYEAKMLVLANCGLPIVRYEDFVMHPEIILKQLLTTLKIPWDDWVVRSHERYTKGQRGHGQIRLWKPIHDASLDSWKDLPKDTIDLILRINAGSMAAFGYEMRAGNLCLRKENPNLIHHDREFSFFGRLKSMLRGV